VVVDGTHDRRLLEAVAAGSPEAFDAFYERFAQPLYALGLRWLQDESDAEELVSDTLVRAWQRADRYEPTRGSVASWLFGIGRHVASDRWRVRRRHIAEPLETVGERSHELDPRGYRSWICRYASWLGIRSPDCGHSSVQAGSRSAASTSTSLPALAST